MQAATPGVVGSSVRSRCTAGHATGRDGPLIRDAGTYWAFIRGPEDIMVELVQPKRDWRQASS
jgi:hypothetical protein